MGIHPRPAEIAISSKPCKRCGGYERNASNRQCHHCSREYNREYQRKRRKENPEKFRHQVQEWREKNGAWLSNYNRRKDMLRNFNITVSEYEQMLESQGGKCAICRGDCPSGRRLAVDHDWDTGKVRGLLCMNCNNGIGRFQHDHELCVKAAAYLKECAAHG